MAVSILEDWQRNWLQDIVNSDLFTVGVISLISITGLGLPMFACGIHLLYNDFIVPCLFTSFLGLVVTVIGLVKLNSALGRVWHSYRRAKHSRQIPDDFSGVDR